MNTSDIIQIVGLVLILGMTIVGGFLRHTVSKMEATVKAVSDKQDRLPMEFAALHARVSDVKTEVTKVGEQGNALKERFNDHMATFHNRRAT